jgi:hypothetical protein
VMASPTSASVVSSPSFLINGVFSPPKSASEHHRSQLCVSTDSAESPTVLAEFSPMNVGTYKSSSFGRNGVNGSTPTSHSSTRTFLRRASTTGDVLTASKAPLSSSGPLGALRRSFESSPSNVYTNGASPSTATGIGNGKTKSHTRSISCFEAQPSLSKHVKKKSYS